jgi:polyribonucleotide nucleotidyltransferase
MGLVFHEGKYTTLTDILGAEDAFGDMDFKVAGTSSSSPRCSSTRDRRPSGRRARRRAGAGQAARLQILDVMHDAIAEPRDEVRPLRRRSSASRSRSTRSAR